MTASEANEQLILVDQNDKQVGVIGKEEAHRKGLLHRAISVFIFNNKGQLLLQKRAEEKYHSAGLWTNSCCSHPREGEDIVEAASRRLQDELGIDAVLEFAFKFIYQAQFENLGSEHELCHVFLGRLRSDPKANPTEIAATRFVSTTELDQEFAADAGALTPWFRLEWERLNGDCADLLARYTSRA